MLFSLLKYQKTFIFLLSRSLSNQKVVYVSDNWHTIKESEQFLRDHGITNFKCYLDGIDAWKKIGGKIQFPRFIKFKASYHYRTFMKKIVVIQ